LEIALDSGGQKEICWDPVVKGQGSSCEG